MDAQHDALRWLTNTLGLELTAQLAGAQAPEVAEWLRGTSPPSAAQERIAKAGAITALLLADEVPEVARVWWFTPNCKLAGLEPWEAMEMDSAGVLEAARTFLDDDCPGCLS
jgi:hypothetical protein